MIRAIQQTVDRASGYTFTQLTSLDFKNAFQHWIGPTWPLDCVALPLGCTGQHGSHMDRPLTSFWQVNKIIATPAAFVSRGPTG